PYTTLFRSVTLCGPAVRHVAVAKAVRRRQMMHGPLVLRVEAHVVFHVGFRRDRKCTLAQLVWNRVLETIADGIQTLARELVPPVGVIEADLHRVRAGDILRAEPRVVAVGMSEQRGIKGTTREVGRRVIG